MDDRGKDGKSASFSPEKPHRGTDTEGSCCKGRGTAPDAAFSACSLNVPSRHAYAHSALRERHYSRHHAPRTSHRHHPSPGPLGFGRIRRGTTATSPPLLPKLLDAGGIRREIAEMPVSVVFRSRRRRGVLPVRRRRRRREKGCNDGHLCGRSRIPPASRSAYSQSMETESCSRWTISRLWRSISSLRGIGS